MSAIVTIDWPHEAVAKITMNNPEINNHGSWAGIFELWEALKSSREAGARVWVLASAVEGHWYEHAWLRDMVDMFQGKPPSGPPDGWFGTLGELTRTHVVSVAAISGDTSGGGCEIGWACDLRVAEKGVLFSQPEVRIGVGTGLGGTSRLLRIIGRTVAAEMVLGGAPITAERLYELGGLNRVVEKGEAIENAVDWATQMASYPPDALSGMKRMLNEAQEMSLQDSVINDQKIFQEFSGSVHAIRLMNEIQEKFDKGASIRETYWPELETASGAAVDRKD
ncbi:MAG: enoyl-CoA hydratase/isomerase family protein [Alphaproteobacteria bacterium]|nr:enoyl-CoA hydratase/isomerase family protein [Alphaproteobacteria bacterium]